MRDSQSKSGDETLMLTGMNRRALLLSGSSLITATALSAAGLATTVRAQQQVAPPKLQMTTDIPADITTPDSVDTRLGTLKFFDGIPDKETTQKVYDNLDFQRGVDAFLNTMPGASLYAMREGLKSIGVNNQTVALFETLMDSKSLFLTPNTETVYLIGWLDLKDGPMVVETPPNTLGFLNDFWFRYIIDMGNAGPDKGKGGKFLVLPPGYKENIPEGYFVAKSTTYGVWLGSRGFLIDGSPKPAVENFKKHLRIYPLAQVENRPETRFINASGMAFNTIHANNFEFYEEVNHIVQEEPIEAQDKELLGQLASIGIVKGRPFAPDGRMKKILTEAAAVANATARAISFNGRDRNFFFYPSKNWYSPGAEGSYLWERDGVRSLDGRIGMFYVATGVTPAMFEKMVGVGSQYAIASLDADKNPFDGAKTYKLHLPPNVPAKTFWSVVLYDTQTRSELQTDQRLPSNGSQNPAMKKNADNSYDIYFSPKAPAGQEGNWIQTVPGKSFFLILRLYGPLEPWFDKTWQPDDVVPVK
nr:DUF1254 domain-containing protein [Bradyrhizobium canariense]